ncbi:transporter substrate-binding domain-containing protein [Vibrio sp. SM6]|uniref:Transporter substrate-binding domain-containing protein n=2 Tax=Vibrio agarilyticus TaxID=2726741 RepID=A0A7X8TNM2_9VIBR|nr:transporter substrate-binding domain-containing protein [Vibrio agarilyticus]
MQGLSCANAIVTWYRVALFFFIFSAVFTSSFAIAETKTVRFGVDGRYPPFSWQEVDGSLRGFDIDLARALCDEMQVNCRFEVRRWPQLIPGLINHEYDAIIAAMSITASRKERIAFSQAYAQIPSRFVATKSMNISIGNLANAKVGVQSGTTHDAYLRDNYWSASESGRPLIEGATKEAEEYGEQNKAITVVRFNTFDEARDALIEGKVDVLLGDAQVLAQTILNQPMGHQFHFIGPWLTETTWFGEGFGIGVRKNDAALKHALDNALNQLNKKAIYQEIAENYFSFEITPNHFGR